MSRSQQPVTALAAPGDAPPEATADATPRHDKPTRAAVVWIRGGTGYGTTIDGRAYRVTKYPAASAMDAPYGAYAEGRFIGSGQTLENVKSRCISHAGRGGSRSSRFTI